MRCGPESGPSSLKWQDQLQGGDEGIGAIRNPRSNGWNVAAIERTGFRRDTTAHRRGLRQSNASGMPRDLRKIASPFRPQSQSPKRFFSPQTCETRAFQMKSDLGFFGQGKRGVMSVMAMRRRQRSRVWKQLSSNSRACIDLPALKFLPDNVSLDLQAAAHAKGFVFRTE